MVYLCGVVPAACLLNLMSLAVRHKQPVENRNNPWIDDHIVKLMYTRDHLKIKAIKFKNEGLWLLYTQVRNCVTEINRYAKKKYYENCIHRKVVPS